MAVRRCIWDDGGSDQPNRQRGQGCWIYGDIWPYGECSHKTKGAREGWPPVAVGGNGDISKGAWGQMIVANDEYIAITRGDCGIIQVAIDMGEDGEYEMTAEDTIELTVRNKPTSESPVVLHKVSAAGIAQIVLHTEDTQIAPGQYTADVQLNHGNCRYTIWPEIDPTKDYKVKNRKNFIVTAEVTIDE